MHDLSTVARIRCCQLKFLQTTDTFTLVCVIDDGQYEHKMCHIAFVAHVEDLTFISGVGAGGGRVAEENAAKPQFNRDDGSRLRLEM